MSDVLDDQHGQTACAVETLTLTVFGTPAPQGSKDAMPIYRNDGEGGKEFTGQVVLLESAKSGVDAWRADIVKVAKLALIEHRNRIPFLGAIAVGFRFTVHRGKTVDRRFPSVRPDLDKLARSTGDGLTDSGLIGDDALIVGFTALEKAYAGGTWLDGSPALDRPGAVITIVALEPNPRLVTKRRAPRPPGVPLRGRQEPAPARSRLTGPARPVEPSPALLEALRASGADPEAGPWT
jgi:Holliday junction resolvase RusA-like endonuclease